MVRSTLAALLLVALVSAVSAGGGYQKKIFHKYAMSNMFVQCIGQTAVDKFMLDYVKAAKRCHNREFDAQLKPVYIKPYPVDGYNTLQSNNIGYHTHRQQNYNPAPFQQQFQQPPYPQQQQYQQYQQYQQQPQYQQQHQHQQYRQPQTFQQPQQFYSPGFGFQPNYPNQVNNQVHTRKVRQANKRTTSRPNVNNVVAETSVAGEAELYYYNKLKHHMTGLVGNMSCVMHELGYFTQDNSINVEKYKQEYQKLTLPDAMKEEFIENIDTCNEVSQCLPDKCFAKYPYGLEYGRSFFFVACEKKKAMEVCLKKQMIDDYYKYKDIVGDAEITEDFGDLFSLGF